MASLFRRGTRTGARPACEDGHCAPTGGDHGSHDCSRPPGQAALVRTAGAGFRAWLPRVNGSIQRVKLLQAALAIEGERQHVFVFFADTVGPDMLELAGA